MSRAVRAPVSGSTSGTAVPEPGNSGREVNSNPRSRARPMTARRAAADALHRSWGSLADWGIVVSSLAGAGSCPGFGLVLDQPGDPEGAVGQGEGEPGGLAGRAGAHPAGLSERGDDPQAPAAFGVRAGFHAPGH